jgi:peptidoglycan/LPS O-acetylase OafA/YrhL
VAKYSYGIYLFHTPCIWLAFGKGRALGTVASTFCLIALVAASSALSYHLIEDPLIRVGKRVASRMTIRSAASDGVAAPVLAVRD